MPEFYSVILRRGNEFDFTHPAEVPEGQIIDEHYGNLRREFGDKFIVVIYRQDAAQTLRAVADFIKNDQPF